MHVTDEYIWGSILVSLTVLVLLALHGRYAVRNYRMHHDDRAAVTLLLSIGKVVMAFGLLVSSIGLLDVNGQSLAVAGLSMTRGTLLIVSLTLLFTDRKVE